MAVALSPDQKTLYAALADMNAVAVVNIANRPVSGFARISSCRVVSQRADCDAGRETFARRRRQGSKAINPNGNMPKGQRSYILDLFEGDVRSIELPDDDDDLPRTTKQVLAQNSLPPPRAALG